MGLTASRLAAAILLAGVIAIVIAVAILFGPAWGLMAAGISAIIVALEDRYVRTP